MGESLNDHVRSDLLLAEAMADLFLRMADNPPGLAEEVERTVDEQMAEFVTNAEVRGFPVNTGFWAGVATVCVFMLAEYRARYNADKVSDLDVAAIFSFGAMLKWCINTIEEGANG